MVGASKLNQIELLRKVVEISNSTVTAETKLQNILKYVVRELDMGQAFIYGLDKNFNNLILRAANDKLSDWPGDRVIPQGVGFVGAAALNKRSITVRHESLAGEPPFWKEYGLRVSLPILDDTFMYGVMVCLSKQTTYLDEEILSLLETVCLQLAGTIRYFRLSMEAKKRITERSALFEIGRTISGTMDLQKLVDQVVIICAKVVSARGALLTIFDIEKNEVITKSAFGRRQVGEAPPLCVALEFQNGLEGTLCVYEKISWEDGRSASFDEDDQRLLMALASFLSSALEKSLVFAKMANLVKKNELLVRRLSTLYDISSDIMTTVDFERILDITLEAVIVKQDLEFDRAVVLLLDDQESILRIHKGLVRCTATDGSEGERCSLADQSLFVRPVPFHTLPGIRDLSLPLDSSAGPLATSLLSGVVAKVTKRVEDVSPESRPLYDFLGSDFAAVPLMAKDKAVGVLVADYSIQGKAISDRELKTLGMLAHQAGLALENSRLYAFIEGVNRELKEAREKLMETEKMAALGEVAAGIAHEIRNPLVSIGGFARRVLKKVPKKSPIKDYLFVIVKEVERLEKILREVLSFAQDEDGAHFEFIDLHRSIEAALSYMRLEFEGGSVVVKREYSEIPKIYGDDRQLRHLFFNLVLNARQAMKDGGVLTIRTYKYRDLEERQRYVAVEVRDSGGGISPHILQNIFNPFFTSKQQGTGLGLSIAHRIIKRHQGDIEVDNRPGEGVSFILKFPVVMQPDDSVSSRK